MEVPVTFKSQNNKTVFGIVHIPKDFNAPKRIGINLLNPGIKYRVAPNRLNIKIARKLCEQNYFVLRFDPEGIGDSEGELPADVAVYDIWRNIQEGLLVPDTICANDFFINQYQLDELIIAGSCGGAITSLITADKDHRISGLCLIDLPVFLIGELHKTYSDIVVEHGEKAEWYFHEYLKKLCSLQAWWRLLSLKTDYKLLWKIVGGRIKNNLFPHKKDQECDLNIEKLCQEKNLNLSVFHAVDRLINMQKRILFILAENDHGYETFKYHFQDFYLKEKCKNSLHEHLIDIHLIELANHIYTFSEWQQSLIDRFVNWLTIHWPLVAKME